MLFLLDPTVATGAHSISSRMALLFPGDILFLNVPEGLNILANKH